MVILPLTVNAQYAHLVMQNSKDVKMEHVKESVQITTLSDSILINLAFPSPVVSKISHYDAVRMLDFPVYGAPGEPVLPVKTIKVLIPQNKAVKDIVVTNFGKKTLEGKFDLECGRTLRPISCDTAVVDAPKQRIYGSANPFPDVLVSAVSEQYLRGYKILPLTVYPVQYVPKIGEIFYFETMLITISLEETSDFSPPLRKVSQDQELIAKIVDNPNDVETSVNMMPYSQPTSVNISNSYDYVIITSNALQSSFQPLVDWKTLKGLNATIVLVEHIMNDSDYDCDGLYGDGCGSRFNDTAAHIRNFIKDAYSNWGTEYVLLGGDDEIVPARGVYAFVGEDVDRNIPCDMYYGALDGSWDNDNDTIFGEGVFEEGPENATAGEEADFFAEVYIGRATVETAEEAANFVNKTLSYEQNPDAPYLNKALMIGEELDDETVGGNGKDLVTDIIPQYTTTRLYDRDGTFSASAVVSNLNGGTHIVNHDGHSNAQFVMGLGTSSVDSLTNTEYFMAYSLGCYSAAFDQGGVSGESIAEHFIFNSNGAFAFIGNSRYGWYFPGMTAGPGEVFDRSFFSTLNSGTRNLGKALQVSKENQYSGNVHRWTYFNLNLLGDPETEIVTDLTVPTAHFKTITNLLNPPVFKGAVDLEGTAKNGTAVGASFANFTIDFGKGKNPSSWSSEGITLANNGQVQVVNDVLATWDISLITPATYTLRLRVLDLNGTIGEDRWIVRVAAMPAVCVNPEVTEVQAGLTFTVDFNITNIEDLYSLDIKIGWNTTLMDYVNHTITIPVEQNPGGILHMPASITKDKLNQTAGTYQIVAKSVEAAYPFTGSGTVFRMIFEARINSSSFLQILSTELLDRYSQPLPHIILNGIVNILPGTHNVAVTAISCVKRNVGCGYNVGINVTAVNRGTFTESFNITVYANGTAASTSLVLLCGNDSKQVIITWDTTGWAKGNYTISAYAAPVTGEIDVSDNNSTDGWIFVTIPGDVDGDRDVDIYDVVKITGIYGSKCGDPQFNPNSDLDDDGEIKIYDVVRCTSHYRQEW
jgi:hypothetical protein